MSCAVTVAVDVASYLYCLNDEPNMVTGTTHYDLDSGSSLRDDIGKDYSLQFQCRLEFGHDFILCAAVSTMGDRRKEESQPACVV